MTATYKEKREKRLQDPEVKKEVGALKNELAVIQALNDARKKHNFTQKELSVRSGINQADISRIERGLANPTLKLLEKLAHGLDMDLELRFVPRSK